MIPLTADDRHLRRLRASLWVIFFVSGALGLVYEVLWLRKLLLVFGSTVHAVSTVLTVFFGGLAIGSWLAGRLIDRRWSSGLRWYAACEMAIGAYAFATPWLFAWVERFYIPLYRASDFSPAVLVGASFVGTAAVLLAPTVLMGATLPLLARHVVQTVRDRGVAVASLYSINTAGAMAGTLAVYFVALPRLGWMMTLQCAGLLNLLLGILARSLDRQFQRAGLSDSPAAAVAPSAHEPASAALPLNVRVLLAAFTLSGFSAMVYEVAWTRTLSLVVGSSVYAFCLILATFLGGIALGSWLARFLLRRRPASLLQVMVLEVGLAAYGLFSISLFGVVPDWLVRLWPVMGTSFAGLSLLQAVLSAAVMIVPTLCMGLLFPIVGELVTGQLGQFGRRLGAVYALNTSGGIVGSFLAGFWLIPELGIPWTLVLAALINLLAGLLIYVQASGRSPAIRVGLAIGVFAVYAGIGTFVFVPSWQRQVLAAGVYNNPQGYQGAPAGKGLQDELLFYRESLNTTVSVHQDPRTDTLYLKVGGKTDASTGSDMGTQILAAHLPMLFHPDAERLLLIGLGSGVTLGSAGRHPLSVLHCAELDPAVIEGARLFADYNYRIHDDPRVTMFVADGRNFLLASPDRYDVIISEPSNPWMAGVANLFTQEFYQLAKQRLAPGGVMAQWLQLYRMFPADVKLILKTFQEAFPHVSVWSTIPGDLLLIGTMEPQRLDYQALARQLAAPAIREDLERVKLGHPQAVLDGFRLNSEQVRQTVADTDWTHTDDLPWLEFNAPKALYAGRAFMLNYRGLDALRAPVSAIADHVPEPDAQAHLALGAAYLYRDELDKAQQALTRAVEADPRSADAHRQLGNVLSRQNLPVKAKEALQIAVALDAQHPDAYWSLARLLWRQRLRAEAMAAYDRAARLRVPSAALAQELGDVWRDDGRSPEAAEFYRSALSRSQRAPVKLLVAFAGVERALGRSDDAAHALAAALREEPEHPELLAALAELEMDRGRAEDAQRLLERLLQADPKRAAGYFLLGRLAQEQGDAPSARKWLMEGLQYDPYNAKALAALETLHGS